MKVGPSWSMVKNLSRLHLAALGIVALLAITAEFITQNRLSKQQADSSVINIAGRQRMLSQNIAKTALLVFESSSDPGIRSQLRSLIDLWTKSHEGLQQGNQNMNLPGHNSPEIAALFTQIEPHYLTMKEAVTKLSYGADAGKPRDVLNLHLRNILKHEAPFLVGMTEIVSQYEAEAQAKVVSLQKTQRLLMGATLLVLLLVELVIFRPTTRVIREQFTQLNSNRNRMRLTLETALDASIGMNRQGIITHWNPQATTIFGWTEEEALGQEVSDLIIPPSLRHKHIEGLQHFLTTGVGPALNQRVELMALHRDGTKFPVELSVAPLQDGEDIDFNAFIRDISDRKQAEAELKQAMVEAQQASRAKGDFLANMSHEIRTPMNGVIGMAELLQDTKLDLVQRNYVKTIVSSGDVLLTLINDILDFSKIEAGKLDLEIICFNLRSLIEEVNDILALKAELQGLEFSGFLDLEVYEFVKGDPTRLRQILTNLVGNAIKFTEQGEVAIRCSRVTETLDEVTVRFEVRDTGIGISPQSQETLFDSFTQEDASTTRRFGGTGLGLSICKKLAEMMGGEIGAHSVKGEGSTFWFTVKLEKQLLSDVKLPPQPATVNGKRILVVDDHATNLEILRLQLESWGCLVSDVDRAAKGLELVSTADSKGEPFDILLVDMQMPGMDGEEFGRCIAANVGIKQPLMVMLTSIGNQGDAERVKEIGFNAYLPKPIKQAELRDCLGILVASSGEVTPRQASAALLTRHSLGDWRRFQARVLLAEDNSVNRQVAKSMLVKLGVEVVIAKDGQEAVDRLAEDKEGFTLVFMDCLMPKMDGFEATRSIRSSEQDDQHLPIIALTANTLKGDREACLAAGMDDFLSKPLKMSALCEVLARWT